MSDNTLLIALIVTMPSLCFVWFFSKRWGFANLMVPIMMVQRYWVDIGFSLKPYLVFGLLLIPGLLFRLKNGRRLGHAIDVFKPVIRPFLLMVFLMLISSFISGAGIRTFRHLILMGFGWLIITIYGVYICNKKYIYSVYGALRFTLFAMGLIACIYYGLYLAGAEWVTSSRLGNGNIYKEVNDITGRLRLYSLDPNHLATFLLSPIFASIGFYFFEKQNHCDRKKTLISLLLGCTAFIFTFSRGGLTSAFIGALFFMLAIPGTKLKKIKNMFLVGVAITLFLLLVSKGSFVEGIQSGFTSRSSFTAEDSGRLALWLGTIDVFEESIWFGVGQGQLPEYTGYQAHNTFLELLAENGLFVFISFLVMLIIVLIKGLRVSRQLLAKGYPDGWLILGVTSGLVAMLTMLVSVSLFTEIFLWFQIGLVLVISKLFQLKYLTAVSPL